MTCFPIISSKQTRAVAKRFLFISGRTNTVFVIPMKNAQSYMTHLNSERKSNVPVKELSHFLKIYPQLDIIKLCVKVLVSLLLVKDGCELCVLSLVSSCSAV